MSQSSPHLLTARAIEDIIQIPKITDKLPKVTESEILKEKFEDADYSFNKHSHVSAFMDNSICLPKVIEGNIIKRDDVKILKRVEGNGSEGDAVNSEDDKLSNSLLESNLELKSWPSDSDITIIRIRQEYLSKFSQRVNWEEERNLTEKTSSRNFDWKSYSLINLANITPKEEDGLEDLTPFTIWAKSEDDLEATNPNSHRSVKFKNRSPNDLIYYPLDKMVFYVPDEVQSEQQPFYNLPKEILSLLDEKINILFQTESSSVVNESLGQQKSEAVSNISLSVNASTKSRKLKLFKNIFTCFAKCGSRKTNLDGD